MKSRLEEAMAGPGRQMPLNYLRTVPASQFKKKHRLTCISLFTGAGGIDLGFAHAGIETRVMVDQAHYCCETLRVNWTWEGIKKRADYASGFIPPIMRRKDYREPAIIEKDICKVSTTEILSAAGLQVGEADIVAGGPPCQGFSTAGKRVIDDPRNFLYKEFVRVVSEALPRMLFFENVPGLASMGKGICIKQIAEDFAGAGYDIVWDILDAADYGVPQHRRRIFLIGKRNDVMVLREDGHVGMYLGGARGEVKHPAWWMKRYKKLFEEVPA